MQRFNPETRGWGSEDAEPGGRTLPAHREPSPRRRAAPAHTDTGLGFESRVRCEEIGGTAAVKNDPLCIKSVFHGLL